MPDTQPLIAELDAALSKASSPRQLAMLRSVIDLFIEGSETFSEAQVAVFDNVIGHLIENAEQPALAELSARLALVGNAPTNVMARLAGDNNVTVSSPVLEKSNVLTDQTLAEIAKEKSQKHLAVIAGRPRISETVTAVLIDRGSPEVAIKLIENQGASFCDLGFVKLIDRARSDKALAAAAANRKDIPPELQPFLKLALA